MWGVHRSVLTFTHGIGLSIGKESGVFLAPLALGLCESCESECKYSKPERDSGTAGRGVRKYIGMRV
jgi:hypothetical protein